MPTIIHFIDVGQGNMVLIETDSGERYCFDCNITNDNEERVLNYVGNAIGWGTPIDAFICSHRDADHMRGVNKLNADFPIRAVWDSGYPGTTTTSTEYLQYMNFRRSVPRHILESFTYRDFGRTRFRYLSSADNRLSNNANAQGIVIKAEHRSIDGTSCLRSAMLTADSDAETWKYGIMQDYNKSSLRASILMAGHHGSITFFDDPNDSEYYFTEHIHAISPEMTIVSVGNNSHGHPDPKAMELYEQNSSGSSNGNKLARTDLIGSIRLTLKDSGGWSMSYDS